jgi:hypothetical protein
VSFVSSKISEQPTAFIFWLTKLIQVASKVRQVTNVHCIGSFEGIWPITTTEGARVDGACPKPWEFRIPRTAFSGPQQMGEVKTARHLGGEWWYKIYLLHVHIGTEGQQCCTRAVRLFCSREHLSAQIPSNVLNNQQIFFHCITSASTWTNSVSMQMEQYVRLKH